MMILLSLIGFVEKGEVNCSVIFVVSRFAASRTSCGIASSRARKRSWLIASTPQPCLGFVCSQNVVAIPTARRAQTRAMPSLPVIFACSAVANSFSIWERAWSLVIVHFSRTCRRHVPTQTEIVGTRLRRVFLVEQ